ncbi:MAG: hypothetical protein AAGP08_10615 [Pseudomonadota bacterium]
MVPLKTEYCERVPQNRAPQVDPAALPALNHLRMIAMKCRSAARADLFEACAVLSSDRTTARVAYAETLMKCLGQATGVRPKMLRPGATEVTFDEAWLARLILAAQSEDDNSFAFLIRSRVPRWAQRNVTFLIKAISGDFDKS